MRALSCSGGDAGLGVALLCSVPGQTGRASAALGNASESVEVCMGWSPFLQLGWRNQNQITASRSTWFSISKTDNCTVLAAEQSGDKKQFPAGEHGELGCI